MRKSIVIVVAFALLGSGYWIFSSLIATKNTDSPVDTSTARIESPLPANDVQSPVAVEPTVNVDTAPALAEPELDEDGDRHAGQPGELQPLVEPPAVAADDPEPIVGELAALQEARAMVQTLLAEIDDPAAREEAEALLEIIDSQEQ
jgi:hypothetical protein